MARKSTLHSANTPIYRTRAQLAAIHLERFGLPLSPRSLERWPLPWRKVGSHAVCSEQDFLAEAARRINSAPVIMGGGKMRQAA